jgi:hypothetical protein
LRLGEPRQISILIQRWALGSAGILPALAGILPGIALMSFLTPLE